MSILPLASMSAGHRLAMPMGARETGPVSALVAPPPDACPGVDRCYDLRIRYQEGRLRNPSIALDPNQPDVGYDRVRLRAYVGDVADAQGTPVSQFEFVAPQIELSPGQTFRLTLHNELPAVEDMEIPAFDADGNPTTVHCADNATSHNQPHCSHFNLTNMHTHGLWVSPDGNSDNVLLSIHPGVSFTYEYNVPEDHVAGTFWYHAHKHGSTAPQVSSGMAGALIIRGDRMPVQLGGLWQRGDLDVILPRPGMRKKRGPTFRERVMVFQQIAYACRYTRAEVDAILAANPGMENPPYVGRIKTVGDVLGAAWRCDPGDVGTLEPGPTPPGSPDQTFDQLTPASWPASGRYTAINGLVAQALRGPDAVVGQVERWRMIHGGVRSTIKVQVRKYNDPAAANAKTRFYYGGVKPEDRSKFMAENCTGAPVPVMGVATDGLTRPVMQERTDTWLQPGYREDILVSFPEPGWYCLVNTDVEDPDAVGGVAAPGVLISAVYVARARKGPPMVSPIEQIRATLAASANAVLPSGDAKTFVLSELSQDRLTAFTKHRPISDAELTPNLGQTVGFNLARVDGQLSFQIGGFEEVEGKVEEGQLPFTLVGAKSYEPTEVDRMLQLGAAEQWRLTSFAAGGHPFHIHVNPFQIMDIRRYLPYADCPGSRPPADPSDPCLDPSIDVSDPATWKDVSGPGDSASEQYAGLKGTWKDTLFTRQGYVLRFRTRYERYIGTFVLHCHILDHEDQGMMQNIRVAIPDGKGGLAPLMTDPGSHGPTPAPVPAAASAHRSVRSAR